MKILTKFFWTSVSLATLTLSLSAGSELLLKQVEKSTEAARSRGDRAFHTVMNLKIALRDQISALKNYISFDRDPSDIAKYHKFKSNFILSLEDLETQISDKSAVANVRRRHKILIRLATELRDETTDRDRTLQDLKAIDSFKEDIDFNVDLLIKSVAQENALGDRQAQQFKQTVQIFRYAIAGLIILVFFGQFVLILLPVIRAVEKLQLGATKIGSGNLSYRLDIQTKDELEQLAREFNQMAEKLAEFYHSLEQKVSERTAELTKANQNLEKEVRDRQLAEAELQQALKNLQHAQAQLIQTEKMSSLGQMVAGIAHEINNPVNFIYGNLTYANDYMESLLQLVELYQKYYPQPASEISDRIENIELEYLTEDLRKILTSMKVGADRIREIVLSLRNFSRLDESELKEVNIHEGLDNTLLILQHRLKAKPEHGSIEIVKKYGNLPTVECCAGQLNQVFLNILANAIDALESYRDRYENSDIKNQITIETELLASNYISVRIADSGPGMTEAVKQRLFDPFFTTKPVGKGTGLGLSISYQIVVEKHQGTLRCNSALGQGTEFVIEIPVQQSASLPCPAAVQVLAGIN